VGKENKRQSDAMRMSIKRQQVNFFYFPVHHALMVCIPEGSAATGSLIRQLVL
jgi:hypothetical protein